jgi:transposase-like protein
MADRGVAVTHTTIMRWVLRYVPEYERRWAQFARPVGSSWRMDETAVSIRGRAYYLYRAVDRKGKSVDSLLCSERTTEAAQAFLRKAVATPGSVWPRTINLDGYTASHRAVRLLGQEDRRWRSVAVRDCRYLNNIIEQDHRAIKQRCASMLGFKSAPSAAVTLSGIELAHRIRKRQFRLDPGKGGWSAGDRSLKCLWDRALTAEPMALGCASLFAPLMHQNCRDGGIGTNRTPAPFPPGQGRPRGLSSVPARAGRPFW